MIKNKIQVIWGIILMSTGISFILRIPYIITRTEQAKQFLGQLIYIKFCLYFIGIFLLLGGTKKLLALRKNISRPRKNNTRK